MDPIVRDMIEQAASSGPININARATDPEVVRDMIERSGLDRRGLMRPEPDRRKADQ